MLSALVPAIVMLQGTVLDFGSVTTIIDSIVQKLKELRTEKSWNKIKEIIRMTVNLGTDNKGEGKQIIH